MWIPNLSEADPWILPLFAGLTTYLSSVTMSTPDTKQDATQSMMKYFMPVMIFWWGRSFPAGLTLYWGISNLFQMGQQLMINKPYVRQREDLKPYRS
ncbi:YidC/Oxa1 family membrane protein insertase [Clostridium formicaceticum]|uniref:Membrane protein insertase MisCA n=1 Tax=Clostridium formicaceticum TaxID=1497 RepID=A0AAC9RLX5_9CLOT|nr:YidC/Oxa1 family membrane protein insertase [Clostridium formicaceticum]ARE88104.1 Membrane protein insertase MisCA precursor [Clostridium formicaceticum]